MATVIRNVASLLWLNLRLVIFVCALVRNKQTYLRLKAIIFQKSTKDVQKCLQAAESATPLFEKKKTKTSSGAGTIFGQRGGKTGNAKLLVYRIWTALLSQK